MYFKRHRIVLLAIAILVLTGGVIRAEDKIIKAEKVTDTKVQKDTTNEGLKRSAEELSIANKFFISGGYYTSNRAYLGFGYAVHKYLRLSINTGFDISNRKEVYEGSKIVDTNSYEFYPSIKADCPIVSGRWTEFVLSLYSGPVIYKVEKGDMEMGNLSGLNIQSEIFGIKEVSASIVLGSGIEYYSYKSPFMGSGFKTNFNIGFNYYF
jgi:hypothetical protein